MLDPAQVVETAQRAADAHTLGTGGIVAAIAAGLAAAVTLLKQIKMGRDIGPERVAKLEQRVDELQKDVEKHNELGDRLIKLESETAHIAKTVDGIKDDIKELSKRVMEAMTKSRSGQYSQTRGKT